MKLDPKASTRAASTYVNLEEKYSILHDNKYDYSKSVFLTSKTKMCIICPSHGEFWQSHNKHYSQKQGCPTCAGKTRKTTEQFIKEATKIHGDRYDYSKVEYTNQYNNIIIICPDHGEFMQSPTNHLAGKRCLKCALKERGENHRLLFKDFLLRANEIHNNKYKYKNYVKASANVTITCPIHGDFEQEATGHIAGKGCPKCSKYGFQPNQPALLYYLKINGGVAYKIGITNKSVQERFLIHELNTIEKLFTLNFDIGKDAYNIEQHILKHFKNQKYTGPDLLSSGNTELFCIDIFKGAKFKSIDALKLFLDN